jgi:uncharacterized membrane protein YphA (DoxX/SURF4 family)
MADIGFPLPKPIGVLPGRLVTASALLAVLMLLFYVLAAINWSAVLSKTDRCRAQAGAFDNGFSNGFLVQRRDCSSQRNALPLGIP